MRGALVLRAVELDPQNIAVMDTHCQILTETGRFNEAELLCQRWLALSPRNESAFLRQSRNLLTWTGDQARALAVLAALPESTGKKGPGQNSQRRPIARGALLAGLKDFAGAIVEYEHVTSRAESQGTNSGPRGIAALRRRGSHGWRRRRGMRPRRASWRNEALRLARKFSADFPEVAGNSMHLAVSHALLGDKIEALTEADRAVKSVALTRDASQIARMRRSKAEVLALLGEKEAAIAELRAVHAMGFGLGYRLRAEFEWETLRGEPKFQQLMKDAEARADAQPRPKQQQ